MEIKNINYSIKWRVLYLCYLVMIVNGIAIQVLTPVNHQIQEILKIDYTMLGILMGAISIPGIFISIPGGYIADRYGSRKLLFFSLICISIGSVVFILKSFFWILCAGRFITGIGCILLSVILPGIFIPYFEGKSLGSAMGIFNTALSLGSIITLSFFGSLAAKIGCFNIFWIPVIISMISILLTIFFLPKTDIITKKRPSLKFTVPKLDDPAIWVLSITVLFTNMATMGYVTIGPSYFISEGYKIAVMGIMLSAVLWGGLFLSPVVGYFTTNKNLSKVFLIWGNLFQGIAFILIPLKITPEYFDIILLCFAAGVIMTPVYIILPRLFKSEHINFGFGIIITAMMIGCLLGPYFAGLSVDKFSGFTPGFIILGAFSFFASIAALFLNKKKYTFS